jgi:fluoride exporter
MKQVILIFLGGGLGSVCRYLISVFFLRQSFFTNYPSGTFFANILGCLLIGLIIGWVEKIGGIRHEWTLLLTTGFCGGFTTFSTFALENNFLLKEGNYTLFFIYTISSLILGLGAVFLGLEFMKGMN